MATDSPRGGPHATGASGTVWTIGHSNRSAEDFLAVLAAHDIEFVADVRRFPGSRRHPQYGAEALESALRTQRIDYAWISTLGGRRRMEPRPEHLGWRNASFRSYAAYTWTEEFAQGLDELLCIAGGRRTAMMCSEVLWWRCHRALISDVLSFMGFEVVHIATQAPGTVHPYTSPARVVEGELVYPAEPNLIDYPHPGHKSSAP